MIQKKQGINDYSRLIVIALLVNKIDVLINIVKKYKLMCVRAN